MSTDPLSDARIVDSWHKNASPWTRAVRANQIESRTIVTNQVEAASRFASKARNHTQSVGVTRGDGRLRRLGCRRAIPSTARFLVGKEAGVAD